MHIVQCKSCLKTATITEDDVDIHDAVDAAGCVCCPIDHHHGRAAGTAANGDVPCRPLLITLMGFPGVEEEDPLVTMAEVRAALKTLEG